VPNVFGTVMMIREALAHFGPNGGSIINIGSVASVSPTPGSVIYSATKGAVETITRPSRRAGRPAYPSEHAAGAGPDRDRRDARRRLIGSELEKELVVRTPLG
jgi:3-oxoacyl-[acyl-carrier protein] reductase